MVTCRTYTIEKAPTPGFTLTADQYEFIGEGPFNTNLHISYAAGAGQITRVVNSDPISGDSCLPTDITLDTSGNATVSYSFSNTNIIYVIIKTGTGGEDCCTSFSQTLCQYSNYIKFSVAPPILATIEISPVTSSLNIGYTQQFTAVCKDQNNNTMTCPTLIWNSSQTPVATIDSTGLLTGVGAGATNVTASSDGIVSNTANVDVTVPASILTTIQISPPSSSVLVGNNQQFGAICKDQNNTVIDCPTIIWSTSDTNIGTIDSTGLFTGLSTGTVSVIATFGTVIETAVVIVTTSVPTLTSIEVTPSSASVTIGDSQQFTAACKDQFNNTITCSTITWSSSNTDIGTIDNNGVFVALSTGTTIITAISGTITGLATANVSSGAVPTTGIGDIAAGLDLLGKNMIWAASVLGIAIFGAVISYKGYKEKELETNKKEFEKEIEISKKEIEISKKTLEKDIEIERLREREIKELTKKK